MLHVGPGVDVRGQHVQVAPRAPAQLGQVAALPGRHAAAAEAAHAADVDAVGAHHLDGVAADLGFVVVDVAALEQHRLGAGVALHQAFLGRPRLERPGREHGQLLVAVDAQRLFEQQPVRGVAVQPVREAAAQARRQPQRVGVGEDALAQREPPDARLLRLVPVGELGEVDREGVAVAGRVGAVDLTLLALEAVVHHGGRLRPCQRAGVTPVLAVGRREQLRERVAVLETHPAAGADVEHPRRLPVQRGLVPVPRIFRVIGEAVRWRVSAASQR
jgi:hypothetical protein